MLSAIHTKKNVSMVYTRNDPTVKKLVSHSNHLTLYYYVHYDKKSAFY